ncbi:hypothetical protein [Pedobacter arcticus]|uniref:hypothetical protein n=1 Tax=Pedobacter arcticus TaxID=752140 RepID=UPI0002FD17ED|nr:hypothetical protein [Pedobacter arcticus]
MENIHPVPQQNSMPEWKAFLEAKCPRCRHGEVFMGATYALNTKKMNMVCPVCKLKFEREPGYFYVAMFASYAMSVAQIVTIGVAAYILGLPAEYDYLWHYLLLIGIGVLGFSPMNYRYSRMALLYWLSPGLNYDTKWASYAVQENGTL